MSTNLCIPSENTLDTVESNVSSESSSVKVNVENQSDRVKVSDLVVGENINEVQLKDKGSRIGTQVRKTELSSIINEIMVEQVVGGEEGVEQDVETVSEAVLDEGNGNNERGLVEDESKDQENQNDGSSVAMEIEPEPAGVTVPVGHLLDVNFEPEVQVKGVTSLEDEERKNVQVNGNHSCAENDSLEADKPDNVAEVSGTVRIIDSHTVVENFDEGIRVTIDSSSVAITESIVEQAQVVEGVEVAMMDCDELFETREVVPSTNAVAGNPSSLDDNQSVEAQAVGGTESESHMALVDGDLASDVLMTEENGSVNKVQNTGIEIVEGEVWTVQTEIQIQKTQVVDGNKDIEAQTALGPSKSTANGSLCHGDETSTQDGKQDTFVLAGETVSHQVYGVEKMDSCPVNENLDDGVHATVDPSLLPDGSRHTGRTIENHVLGDGMLPDVSQENGAAINEMEGDTDFSVLVLDEELISDKMDVDNFEGNNIEMRDNFAGFEQRKSMEQQQVVKTETLKPEPTARYVLIPGRENEFSVHNPEDHAYPKNRKEKSLSDLMATKKPDIDDHNHADVDSTAPQSFKVGECIRRIANQLTGGPSILKSGSKNPQEKGVAFLKKHSCRDLLSKLRLAASDHKKGHSVLTVIGGFFSEFRNSSSLNYAGLKQRKKSEHMVGSAEPFDFDDTNDSYWTDRIVQNSSDEQATEKNSEGKEETDLEANPAKTDNVSQAPRNPPRLVVTKVILGDGENEPTLSTRKNRKRKENSDQENALLSSGPGPSTKISSTGRPRKKKEPPLAPTDTNVNQLNDVQEKKGPTALLLKFTEPYPVPSVTNLNKMFRCFGPLKESETEVVKETNSAMVVFKMYSDAEVALGSAGKFSIFGPGVVSHELSCFPLPPPKVSVCDATQGSDFLNLLEEASLCDTTQGGGKVKLLEEAPLYDTTQGSENVKVLEEASVSDATQGSHDVKLSEEASVSDATQGSHDVKLSEEAPLCDTTQGSHDVKFLEGNTT